MNRAIAFAIPVVRSAAGSSRADLLDRARGMIVIGCAAALILARQPLPF
ncbi:hypothetical protein J3454_07630 [Erythrobacter sp. NFXS35]